MSSDELSPDLDNRYEEPSGALAWTDFDALEENDNIIYVSEETFDWLLDYLNDNDSDEDGNNILGKLSDL